MKVCIITGLLASSKGLDPLLYILLWPGVIILFIAIITILMSIVFFVIVILITMILFVYYSNVRNTVTTY